MRWIWYCTLLAYIAFLLGLIYTIIIDYDDKNPVKTICWILVVIFLPLLGISAYYIVGRNVSKSVQNFSFGEKNSTGTNNPFLPTWKQSQYIPIIIKN